MTRVLRKIVACPECGHLQTALVWYSWNARLSGPFSEDRFRITCEGCGVQVVPQHRDVRADPPGLLARLFGRRSSGSAD